MNIFFWAVQGLLAFHTVIGAIWKFSNSAQTMPSLSVIPQFIWWLLIPFEIACAVGLVLPAFKKETGRLVPIAAAGIAIEMILFSVLHLYSGDAHTGPMIYWLVVATICGFLAYIRYAKEPIE